MCCRVPERLNLTGNQWHRALAPICKSLKYFLPDILISVQLVSSHVCVCVCAFASGDNNSKKASCAAGLWWVFKALLHSKTTLKGRLLECGCCTVKPVGRSRSRSNLPVVFASCVSEKKSQRWFEAHKQVQVRPRLCLSDANTASTPLIFSFHVRYGRIS